MRINPSNPVIVQGDGKVLLETRHPEFDKAVRLIIEKARSRGIGAGIHFWANLGQEIEWARAGANLFLHSADVLLFTAALRNDLAEARSALGDEVKLGDQVVDPI